MPFAKYEGLGNDFIVVDAGVSDEAAFTEERVRALCDRRFGIGGDGVLLILPPQTSSAAGRMKVLNADVASDADVRASARARIVARYAEVDALRWLIEEFRVSQFAQELKTAEPVSAKRLAKLVETLG